MVLPDLISTREFDRDMLNLIGSLQLALRADIGIYGLEFSNTEDEGKPVMPESWYEQNQGSTRRTHRWLSSLTATITNNERHEDY